MLLFVLMVKVVSYRLGGIWCVKLCMKLVGLLLLDDMFLCSKVSICVCDFRWMWFLFSVVCRCELG